MGRARRLLESNKRASRLCVCDIGRPCWSLWVRKGGAGLAGCVQSVYI